MIYLISTSLRPNGSLYEYPPKLIPNKVTLENYRYIIFKVDFYRSFLNSFIVALCSTLLAAFISSSLAFCLARFDFPGKRLLFATIMATMIIPGMTLIIPQFELAVTFKLINKLGGLIPVYVAWVLPFSTFMIKGFIEGIPTDFDEAIYIDGGNAFTVYRTIILPLASPSIAAVSIFNFLMAWEEYPWALTVINDLEKRTLPITISGFFGQHNFTQWGYVFAMSVISLLPVIITFLFFQQYFVSGLSSGAIK
jgi:ABC-type glycerol-3-phosphate transport system permease component